MTEVTLAPTSAGQRQGTGKRRAVACCKLLQSDGLLISFEQIKNTEAKVTQSQSDLKYLKVSQSDPGLQCWAVTGERRAAACLCSLLIICFATFTLLLKIKHMALV